MNKSRLLGRMVEAGFTQRTLAANLGKSENTISSKINGITAFTTDEILAICDLLQITDDRDKAQIFLSHPSQ